MKHNNKTTPTDQPHTDKGEGFTPDYVKWERVENFGKSRIMEGDKNICSMYSESEDYAPLIAEAKNMYYALKGLCDKLEKLALWDKTDSNYYAAKAIINRIESPIK